MYEQNKSINSFTVGTDSEKYDESKVANIVSENGNTNHQSIVPTNLNFDYVNLL